MASVSVDRTVASLGFGRSFSSARISLGGGGAIHGGGDWSLVRFDREGGRGKRWRGGAWAGAALLLSLRLDTRRVADPRVA